MATPQIQLDGKTFFERTIITTMKMNDGVWLRHANPLSVWSRFTCLPFIVLAVWSRVWLDLWFLLPLSLALLWTWFNPRVFSVPANFDHWPAKATFGERVWLNRHHVPIPQRHEKMAALLCLLIIPCVLLLIYGLYVFDLYATLFGMVLSMVFKVWFCDRMVWLYEDMRKKNAVYASWIRRPVNDNHGRAAA